MPKEKADVVAIMDNRAKAVIRSQTHRDLSHWQTDHVPDMKTSDLHR